jgi:AcrR family transcriptional regulator
MPRPKTLPDTDVLRAAYRLMHEREPEAVTFATVGDACGLSPSTLVQRFGSKDRLIQSTLLYAWDGLDEQTAKLAAAVPRTPDGAIELLVALSRNYGGIEAYANGLLVLREDIRNPVLRARGTAWKAALSAVLQECFRDLPQVRRGIGLLMAAQWQGTLLWWSFDPRGKVERFVEDSLRHFVSVIVSPAKRQWKRRKSRR